MTRRGRAAPHPSVPGAPKHSGNEEDDVADYEIGDDDDCRPHPPMGVVGIEEVVHWPAEVAGIPDVQPEVGQENKKPGERHEPAQPSLVATSENPIKGHKNRARNVDKFAGEVGILGTQQSGENDPRQYCHGSGGAAEPPVISLESIPVRAFHDEDADH